MNNTMKSVFAIQNRSAEKEVRSHKSPTRTKLRPPKEDHQVYKQDYLSEHPDLLARNGLR